MNYPEALRYYPVLNDLTEHAETADRKTLQALAEECAIAVAEEQTARAVLMFLIDRVYAEGKNIEEIIEELDTLINNHSQATERFTHAIEKRSRQIMPVLVQPIGGKHELQ